MPDDTLNLTQSLDFDEKRLKIVDNGDGPYAIAVAPTSTSLPTGASTSANQTLVLAELRAINLLSSVVYDEILITYTDATKAVISKVEWKLSSVVVKTLTPTFAATTDAWVKT